MADIIPTPYNPAQADQSKPIGNIGELTKPISMQRPLSESDLQKEFTYQQLPGMTALVVYQGEVALAQGGTGGMVLPYRVARQMREHPSVKIARRELACGTILSEWEVEVKPNAPMGAAELIQEVFVDHRDEIIQQMTYDLIDFGHSSWEKIFYVNADGKQCMRLKNLVPELTWIIVTGVNQNGYGGGAYLGLRQAWIALNAKKCLLISHQLDGTNWAGRPEMLSTLIAWEDHQLCNSKAKIYDRKVSGTNRTLVYPAMKKFDANGNCILDTTKLAQDVLNKTESGDSVALPSLLVEYLDKIAQPGVPNGIAESLDWQFRDLESAPQQEHFNERLGYLDKLIARSLGCKERGLYEQVGGGGSRADSETHSTAGDESSFQIHKNILNALNSQCVDQLLEYNFGADAIGTIRIIIKEAEVMEAQPTDTEDEEDTTTTETKLAADLFYRTPVNELSSDDIKVYLVDGQVVRDTMEIDFALGGNWRAYPNAVPNGEIWLEKTLAADERRFIFIHELTEATLMGQGMTYAQAHEKANAVELSYRQKEN